MTKRSPFKYSYTSPGITRLTDKMHLRFPLSLCNFENLLHAPGIEISQETVRHGWSRFGRGTPATVTLQF